MKKNILKGAIFIMLLTLMLLTLNSVLKLKYRDGIYGLKTFYELPENSVDVLLLGSSHVFEDINPAIFWEQQGIAAYDLCGAVQPLWNSYYNLKEALKTQKPKLIILEGMCLTYINEYASEDKQAKNVLGMKYSQNKKEAIEVSIPEDKRINYYLPHLLYHNTYYDLDREDFKPYLGNENIYKNWKGFEAQFASEKIDRPSIPESIEPMWISEKSEEYFRKIIELAREEGIPIEIVISPFQVTQIGYQQFLGGKKIAEEYGVPFTDYNNYYDELNLDFDTDFADVEHLNYKGSRKYTEKLLQDILMKYNLPNHKNEEKYISWKNNAKAYKYQEQDQKLTEIQDYREYLLALQLFDNEDYTIVLSTVGQLPLIFDTLPYLEGIGINAASITCGSTWIKNDQNFIYYSGENERYEHHDSIGDSDLLVSVDNDDDDVSMIFDREYIHTINNGIQVLVYNNYRGCYVDCVGIDMDNNCMIIRNNQ